LVVEFNRIRQLIDDFPYTFSGFKDKLNQYFAICSESERLQLLELNQIKSKCVSIESDNEVFLSTVVSLNEHD
jgi:cytoplasmic iron level regulating protein YaaA (DUF328/UPF0246 family)